MNNYQDISELKGLPLAKGGIYIILNTRNGKFYVGSTFHFLKRWNKHINELNKNRHHSCHLQNAWNKYGADAFQFVIVEVIEDFKLLIPIEQLWLDTKEHSYNTSLKAESALGVKRSIETKLKMSIASKNRKPPTEETRLKMSASAKIKVFTEEHRKSMSISQTGRTHPDAVKRKISNAHMNKIHSAEHNKNMGATKRKPDKWPHEKGNRCTCDECKIKKNAEERINQAKRKLKKEK